MPAWASLIGIGLVAGVILAAATIWRRLGPYLLVGRYGRIVEQAEARPNADPGRTQEALRLAIKRLRPIQSTLAERCRCHGVSDRVLLYLANPATVRLKDVTQDILGRAEFDIGLSLLSQLTLVQKSASGVSDARATRCASSRFPTDGREQLLNGVREEAIGHLKAAVALAPKRADYLYALARAYELADRNEKAS